MKPGFVIVSEEGVNPKVLRLVKWFCRRIRKVTPVNHVIGVRLVNQMKGPKGVWTDKKNREIWGGFASPKTRKTATKIGWWKPSYDCMILIPARIRRRGTSRKDAKYLLLFTMMHEMVHYMQFRDRKKLTERRVDKRAFHMFDRWHAMEGLTQ